MYNGQKRVHARKSQVIATPNGLVANIYGPVEDRFMTVDRMLIWIFYLFYNNIELIKLEINYMEHIYGDLFYPLRT